MGLPVLPGSLNLKPDTVLIGLHCTRTTVSPVVAPQGGSNFVSGVGFSTIHWSAARSSYLDDVSFGGGGGLAHSMSSSTKIRRYASPSAAVGPAGRGQLPAQGGAAGAGAGRGGAAPGRGGAGGGGGGSYLILDDGGGGIFRNLWVESGPGGMRVRTPPRPARSISSPTSTIRATR